MELRLLGQNASWKTATAGHLAATVWSRKTVIADYDALLALFRPFMALHGKIVTLSVLDVGDLSPSKELRARIKQFADELEPFVHCSAVVLRCGGLEEVVIYSLLNVMNLASRARHLPHVSRSLDGAVEWLYRHDERFAQLTALAPLQGAVARFAPPPGQR